MTPKKPAAAAEDPQRESTGLGNGGDRIGVVGPQGRERARAKTETGIGQFGIGIAQRAGVAELQEKLAYDLYYIKNYNPLFDFWIILKTVRVVLLGSGAQ